MIQNVYIKNYGGSAPAPQNYTAMPLATGQTISYATGDDGDEQQGRDFFELEEDNHFGHKWRFTGVTGGYYDRNTSEFKDVNGNVTTKTLAFPDYVVCDHATKQKISGEDSILTHYMDSSWLGIPNIDWATAVAYNTTVNSIAPAGFNDKWFMSNQNQLISLQYNGRLQYEPFLLGHGSIFLMTSTTSPILSTYYMYIDLWNGGSTIRDKSSAGQGNYYAVYTRVTKLTEL